MPAFVDFNNFYDDIKIYNPEPYVLISGLTGTTKYVGISLTSGDTSKSTWRIKKEWQSGNIKLMGFPNGDQSYSYVWDSGSTYTYK
jgi:hypothetical protein